MTTTKSDRTAEEFKAAARRVFAERGYSATKITDITGEAGRAVGGIYRYFPSKAAVLKALADDFLETRHQKVAHTSGPGHTMTTEQDVRDHVKAYWRSYKEHRPEMLAIHDAAITDHEFAVIQQEIRSGDIRIWRKHIRELRTHLGRPTAESAALAELVVDQLETYCYNALHPGGSTPRATVNALASFVYDGISN